ncbi:hypothetical protein C3B47_01805 [Flavobacterium columnare]|nr:hypothetical protein [Flavobacterium columnare]MBF6654761.1 hypothetical protein [Flavobacterium columnare]OOB82477.1 hypothetical protein BZL53_08975 [Flavobacterium columnare]
MPALQTKLQVKLPFDKPKLKVPPKCPCCKKENLHILAVFDKRGPPAWYFGDSQNSNSCKS